MAEVGISAKLDGGIRFIRLSLTLIPLGQLRSWLIPGLPGKDTGLPSSAWITDGVRSCLFAGGITIHVAGTEEPANYTPYRFGHSVSTSFAVYTSRHLHGSSHMLTIPIKPNSLAPDVGAQQVFFTESLYGLYCQDSFAHSRYQKCTYP